MHRLRGAFPPLIAFLVHRAFVAVCAASQEYSPFAAETYARWDSGFYLEIAAHGYAPLFHCPPASGYPAAAWCGNAGWFPGYSWAIAPFLHAGLSPAGAGFAVAAVAELCCLAVVWFWSRNLVALWFAAFFPGNIYLAAIFPQAFSALCAVLCLWGCANGRWAVAAAAGFCAALCHPLGILLAAVSGLWWLLQRNRRGWLVPCAVVLGYALVLFVLQKQAGRWDAYFAIQGKYGYRLSFGVDSLFARLKPLVNPRYRNAKNVASALQTLLCASLVVSLAVSLWQSHRTATGNGGAEAAAPPRAAALARGRLPRPPARGALPRPAQHLLLAYTLLFWATPLTLGGQLSLYRSELLLLPAALVVPSLPKPVQQGLLLAAVAISIPMDVLFFRGVLV